MLPVHGFLPHLIVHVREAWHGNTFAGEPGRQWQSIAGSFATSTPRHVDHGINGAAKAGQAKTEITGAQNVQTNRPNMAKEILDEF